MIDRNAPDLARRNLLFGGLLLATGGLTFSRLPDQRIVAVTRPNVNDVIPTDIVGWIALSDEDAILPAEDEQKSAAVYEDQISRSYTNGVAPKIMFVLAYDRHQSGMLMVHRPESCYPGSGFIITADQPADIRLSPHLVPRGRFLSTRRNERVEQVLYWTRLGDHFPTSWDDERYDLAMQNLAGFAPDGALVRLSCISMDVAASKVYLTAFAQKLYASCGRDGRALLGGPATAST
ncbi:MAG: methanolan biosynthesis EpsI [Sphingomonadales bacterium]|nr:methanolan biosynthesis EpsI [Sphingomonadales bacterium]